MTLLEENTKSLCTTIILYRVTLIVLSYISTIYHIQGCKNDLSSFNINIFVVECYFNFFTYPVNGGKNVVTFSTRHLCVLNFMLHSLHAPVIPRSAI